MNRAMRRASATNGMRMQRREWDAFRDVTAEAIERHRLFSPLSKFTCDVVWQNNRYVVMGFRECKILGRPATKLMIRRCDSEPIYSWPDLQRIKNELFGYEAEAIQMFPKTSELVDDANLYWLWIL